MAAKLAGLGQADANQILHFWPNCQESFVFSVSGDSFMTWLYVSVNMRLAFTNGDDFTYCSLDPVLKLL